jgi:hypothetical protein
MSERHGATMQINCRGMLPRWRAERNGSYGMGECCGKPLRGKTDIIHRRLRIKIRVEATRRREADKLPRNVAALAWPSRKPVTGWVNVAGRNQGRKTTEFTVKSNQNPCQMRHSAAEQAIDRGMLPELAGTGAGR